jgi:TolA-binding protein
MLLIWLACMAVATSLAGCAPNADMEQLQANESALRGMVANDRQQMESLQEQVARLNDRLTELEHNGGSGGGGSGSAALEQRLRKLESQVLSTQPTPTAAVPAGTTAGPGAAPIAGAGSAASAALAATAEGVGTDSGTNAGAVASSATGAGPAETGIASVAPLAAPAPRPAAPRPAAPPPTASAPSWRAELDRELVAPYSDPAVRLYRSGLADIRASRYPGGAVKLQELQHKFPKSELSEPAEYFCANALYESGKYDQSILQFNDLTMRFPNGRYATASLLREAQAFMKINDRIDARLTLQKLIGDHPNSPETPQARSMMQTLASG